jgi:hypothetical protein
MIFLLIRAEISIEEVCRKKTDVNSLDSIANQYRVKRKMDLFL